MLGPRREERGVALVIFALSLVVLMLFAAFAIDLGQVYAERRKDQNAVDAAVMSGAIELLQAGTAQAALDEVLAKVDTVLNTAVPVGDWLSCNDSNSLTRTAATLGLSPATNCVSFSAGFDRLRVKVPDQVLDTYFSGVVGIDTLSSYAFAEASLQPLSGGALPFVVLASNGIGDQICLRTDGTGGAEPPNQPPPSGDPYGTGFQLDPCDAANFVTHEGARGTLRPYRYEGCSSGPGNTAVVDAIIDGMDHPLGVFDPEVLLAPGDSVDDLSPFPGQRVDGDSSCTTAVPNTVAVDTGLTAQELICALLETSCTGGIVTNNRPGRLSTSSGPARFADLHINDVPLWDYFVSPLPTGAPPSCSDASSSSTEFNLRRAALQDCLRNWVSGELFEEEIAEDRRFGYVPRIGELGICDTQPDPPADDCQGNGPLTHVHINTFSPVYIDGIYQYATDMAPCDTTNPATPAGYEGWAIHYPGTDMSCGNGPGSDVVHRVSGIVLPCGALPPTVCDPSSNPPFPDASGITRVRLAK